MLITKNVASACLIQHPSRWGHNAKVRVFPIESSSLQIDGNNSADCLSCLRAARAAISELLTFVGMVAASSKRVHVVKCPHNFSTRIQQGPHALMIHYSGHPVKVNYGIRPNLRGVQTFQVPSQWREKSFLPMGRQSPFI